MIGVVLRRFRQGCRTMKLPPALPERFRGLPEIDFSLCRNACRECAARCPTGAITFPDDVRFALDLGRCLFCGDCAAACPEGAIRFGGDWRLAARSRDALILDGREYRPAAELEKKLRRLLGRSLKLRQVSAGGCNACEADCNVLSTVGWDMGRFGIQFVASPRHADGILVTGPVTRNMRLALEKTYEAVPSPKIVIAAGACAVSGGPYIDSEQALGGVGGLLAVDVFVPGCPPHPLTILDGLLRLLGRSL
jgi:Ni,Fe-hydrogenase III small subunit/NAD-dependent dihydropyrimidine dehydrogenase PreA subunit